ncbi:hypothetical protein OG21DRAFT_1567390 [Imleria badia]|nr:hypothetical protein OG21DRAFT_1567390 [Imleria badia]
MGGVITANCIVQRLTDYLWVPPHSTHVDAHYHRIVRVLYALRESIQKLLSWYNTIQDVPRFNPSALAGHPQFFPSPNTYKSGLNIKNRSKGTSHVLRIGPRPSRTAQRTSWSSSSPEKAHREMESTGFAPKFLYCGPINVTSDMPSYSDLRMVVMQFVEGLTLEEAVKRNEVPPSLKDDLSRAIKQLHDADYVFGDLRPPNVIVTPEGTSTVRLIDFEWAGQYDEVKDPVSISRSIKWPEGVQGLKPIRKEHDLVMLQLYIPSTVHTLINSTTSRHGSLG